MVAYHAIVFDVLRCITNKQTHTHKNKQINKQNKQIKTCVLYSSDLLIFLLLVSMGEQLGMYITCLIYTNTMPEVYIDLFT